MFLITQLSISVLFHRFWWLDLLIIFLLGGVFYFFYRKKLKRMQVQKDLLETQVKHRTIEIIKQKEQVEKQRKLLQEEKEKTEKLLLNILPREMAEELKDKGKAKARQYRNATVMFADFKGFTKIAENHEPQELVAILDSYFIKFDEVVNKYNVEKIKTIGDAYMAAGGVPIRNKSNPIDTTLAALEMQRAVKELNQAREKINLTPWELRIGIHSGALIAGVVGIKRYMGGHRKCRSQNGINRRNQ